MEDVCTKRGEQFMWKGVLNDGTIKVEFDKDEQEHSLVDEIMDNAELSKFGLSGNGFFANFDAITGTFNLFGTNEVRLVLLIDGKDCMCNDELKNKIIMFRTAESILNPSSGGQTVANIFKYSFGYKLENEYCYIRAIIDIDMYDGIHITLSVTGKDDISAQMILKINEIDVCTKDIELNKNVRKEISVPIQIK